ncbi:MAG: mandelate racemase/muconate lactonizing enzyme family protein [Chloroflexi bacterium]|nr:MAG: mandelate racemase/muconate lactonizing enzyme family protein [Phototrophicales bacterium]RMF82722.1 MAG: mandelate racemase/muconate lactonizing enzyme family protein [Chloroflexota bacterium]
MPVKKIDVFPLQYQETNDRLADRQITLVRMETDDGIVGWGEGITMFTPATLATTAMLENGLADLVIGRDPLDNEAIWHDLVREVWWYGDVGGIAAFAISALDMALWDLKGKILNAPLYTLLGGKKHERLPACASTHPSHAKIDDLAKELGDHVANGYQLVKAGFGKKGEANLGVDAGRDIAYVRAVREAIGPDAGFIIDVGAKMFWDVPYAIKMARAFNESNLTWLEDVFHPDNMHAHTYLRQAVPDLRIGFGERYWNLDDYQRLLEAHICDVILVDPGRALGVTGMHRITQLAARYHVKMDPHSWSSAVNGAASIHVALSNPNASIFELKPVENPMQHELVTNPIGHVDGWVYAPEGPGLGVDVIEDVVHKYHLRS